MLRMSFWTVLAEERSLALNLLCLGLEGVLVPEIWQAVASSTDIAAVCTYPNCNPP